MRYQNAFAILLGRWTEFLSWLKRQGKLDNPHLADKIHDDSLDLEPGYCPVHEGVSGEAWHFYPDAELSGGSVCNTCGSFGTGLALLNKLYGKDTVLAWVAEWAAENGLTEPTDAISNRIWQWHSAMHWNVATGYLRKRGLDLREGDLPEAVRGSREFPVFGPKGERYGKRPAVLTLIRTADGMPATYQMIALDETLGKAKDIPAKHVKRTAGIREKRRLRGAYAELGEMSGRCLVLAEGMETGMALRLALYRLGLRPRIRVMLGGAGLTFLDMKPDPEVDTVILAADADAVPKLLEVAKSRAHPLFSENRKIFLASPKTRGNPKRDWLDVYAEEGIDAVQHGLADAVELRHALADPDGMPSREDASILNLDEMPEQELYRRFDQSFLKQPPKNWYVRKGTIVEVQGDRLEPPSYYRVAAELDERFRFFDDKYQRLPMSTVRKWWSRQTLQVALMKRLPSIAGVLRRPTAVAEVDPASGWLQIRAIDRDGLDQGSGYLLHLTKAEQQLWRSAQTADRTYAWTMGQVVLRDLFGDFRFASEADKANAFAALVTPMLTGMSGPVPFILADAPTPGSGKTTLMRVVGAPWGGLADVEYTHDDAEFSKKLASAFISGEPLLFLDNLTGVVDSDNLKRLITAPGEMGLRVLGGNSMIYPPSGLVVFGTANNPRIQEEIQRRTLNIRLDSRMENPAMRNDFRRTNLVEWATHHAGSLRHACYSMLQAWMADGAPVERAPVTFTGFERWADLVYSLMRYVGLPEAKAFLGNREERLLQADPEMEENRAFVQLWQERYGNEPVTSADLRKLARKNKLLATIHEPSGEVAQDRRMKSWLRDMQDRVFCGCRITTINQRTRRARIMYCLEPVEMA